MGGLSKTVDFKVNKIDIGGHRFFSKSDLIMEWWAQILPVQGSPEEDFKDGPNRNRKTMSCCCVPDLPESYSGGNFSNILFP